VHRLSEGTINSADLLALVGNLDRFSSPGALQAGLEALGCISGRAASAGPPIEEDQEPTPSPSTENSHPINPARASLGVG